MTNEEKGVATKRQYKIPIECLEEALRRMNFYRTKTTLMAIHYKRADGLHVVLTSRTRKKGRPSRKVKREVGKGKITIVKVHKDDLRTHKAVKLNPTECDKFLSELTSLAHLGFLPHENAITVPDKPVIAENTSLFHLPRNAMCAISSVDRISVMAIVNFTP